MNRVRLEIDQVSGQDVLTGGHYRAQGAVIRKAGVRTGRADEWTVAGRMALPEGKPASGPGVYCKAGRLPGNLATQLRAQFYAWCCGHGFTESCAAAM